MAIAQVDGVIAAVVQRYVDRLIERHIPVWRVYLYGSQAKGTAKPDSDIDLAVFLDLNEIDGFHEDVELRRLRWDVDLRIEPHSYTRLDFDEMTPDVKEIVETGQRVL